LAQVLWRNKVVRTLVSPDRSSGIIGLPHCT
jgi:hypothetical protein